MMVGSAVRVGMGMRMCVGAVTARPWRRPGEHPGGQEVDQQTQRGDPDSLVVGDGARVEQPRDAFVNHEHGHAH